MTPCRLVEVYRRFRGASAFLTMETADTSEILVNVYQTTRRCTSEDRHLQIINYSLICQCPGSQVETSARGVHSKDSFHLQVFYVTECVLIFERKQRWLGCQYLALSKLSTFYRCSANHKNELPLQRTAKINSEKLSTFFVSRSHCATELVSVRTQLAHGLAVMLQSVSRSRCWVAQPRALHRDPLPQVAHNFPCS
jgi:predicted metal-binding protein